MEQPGMAESLNTANRDLLALALEATSDGIWVWHVPSGDAYFNDRYYTMLGYAPDEMPASYDTWVSLLHPDDAGPTQQAIQEHLQKRSRGYQIEFRMRTKSNRYLWIMGRGKVVDWGDDGQPVRMVGSHVNIDVRKRTEEKLFDYRSLLEKKVLERTLALEQTTAMFEAVFNAIPDILGVQDNRHHIIRYNAAGYAFLDKTHDEVVGKRCFELIGRTRECDNCATSECYRTKKPASLVRYEDALDVWLDVRAYPILDEKGHLTGVIEHLRDITNEKKAEAENRRLHQHLQQAQKMEAVGTLSGGIAHDFNNLLMGIQGRTSLMAVDLEPPHPHLEHIGAIEEYIKSATDLTKQLLGVARGGTFEIRPTDLNALLVDSATMFGRTKKEIRIHYQLHGEPIVVAMDRMQIDQVLLNLFVNAWQAMPDGGDLTLETTIVSIDDAFARPYDAKPGEYVRLSVTDTGIGMDASVQQRIFDPFFTTKDKGRGTGLGLASAYGIIKNHSGIITVSSAVGEGTTFTIFLPLSDQVAVDQDHPNSGLVCGSGTLLLVDDEEMITDVGRAMLEKVGYRVLVANSGEQAVDMVKSQGSIVDLVILDLIMPGMNGDQAFDRIRELRPTLPVLLSSGYAINGQATEVMNKGCDGFIQKPFNISELSQKVRSLLRMAGG
jgi:two-component system cell cycle sensor histidine kinase/response regulator CckA